MNNIKPSIFVFLILSTIITLFPPFQWGNDRLKTIEERKTSRGLYSDILPMKEYNFIFSPAKKDFAINNNTVSLNRELITSEIILEYLFAIIISSIFYFFYVKFGKISFGLFTYFILAGAIIIFWSVFGRDFLMLFNPNYDIVLNKGKEVKEKYSEWINSFSAFVFINGLKEINHSYNYKLDNWNDTYYRWNDSTQKVWRHIKNKIVIPPERLPKINDYIFPYRDESSNSQAITNLVKRKNRYLASEYNINKKEVLKYYPDFTPPSTKYLSANNILTDIDKIKYDFFNDNFDIDITYLSVRESYFQSQIDYKAFVDKISVYIAIFIIALLIVLLFYRKLFIVKYISKMVNA